VSSCFHAAQRSAPDSCRVEDYIHFDTDHVIGYGAYSAGRIREQTRWLFSHIQTRKQSQDVILYIDVDWVVMMFASCGYHGHQLTCAGSQLWFFLFCVWCINTSASFFVYTDECQLHVHGSQCIISLQLRIFIAGGTRQQWLLDTSTRSLVTCSS
jgi:hypothetical protein